MDEYEQKLKRVCECTQGEISDEFIQELLAQESNKKVSQKVRRRYVLPIAAAIIAAVSLGSGWAYLRLSQPVSPTVSDPDFVQAVTPPSDDSSLSGSSKTEAPAAKPPAEKTDAELKPSADNVPPAKAEQGQTSNPTPDGPASVKPTGEAHVDSDVGTDTQPDSTTHWWPNGTADIKPNDTTPVKPIDPTPVKPDNPNPPWPSETNPPVVPPVDDPPVEPPDDPPDDPPVEPPVDDSPVVPPDNPPIELPDDPPVDDPLQICVSYLTEDGKETLILTLLSTDERFEIDVTGRLRELAERAHTAGEAPGLLVYTDRCIAFGSTIIYHLSLDSDSTVNAEVEIENVNQSNEKGKEHTHEK